MATKRNKRELPVVQPKDGNSRTKKRKSGRGRLRALVLVIVHVVIILHITHYYVSGRTVSPIEPSEAMYTLEGGHINAGVIFFSLAIIGTAVFGRFFCGWGCHLVALQDLCSYMLRRIGLRPKPLRSRMLAIVPFVVAFYMFLWPTVRRLWFGELHPGFSNHIMTDDFWRTFPGPAVAIVTFLVCGGLIVYLLGNKGFCTYACPYGAFFATADLVAVGRIRVTDACQHCGQCTAACTSNVMVAKEVKEFGMVVDPGCMKCMDCVSVCPNDALYFGFAQSVEERKGSHRKSYDFSLAEDIAGLAITAITVFALKSLYDIVPFLLAVALGVITAFFAIQCWRMFRRRDSRIQNHQLKRNGNITTSGRATAVLLCIWLMLIAHSFFVQYHRFRGKQNLAKIDVVLNDAFQAEPGQITAEEAVNIDAARTSFEYSDRFGFANVYDVKVGLATTAIMKNDIDDAIEFLRQAYELRPDSVRNWLIKYLEVNGRHEEARKVL